MIYTVSKDNITELEMMPEFVKKLGIKRFFIQVIGIRGESANEKDTPFIKRSEAENRNNAGIRLATMHRVKGLEFDRVIIAGVNDGIVPLSNNWNQPSDQVTKKENETQERALLYVAATRAKKEVIVTSFGESSRFIK